MKRKIVCLLLGALFLAVTGRVYAQQPAAKVPRIGFLTSGSASDPSTVLRLDVFRRGLRDLGYVEGKDINIEYRYAEGKSERLTELAEELVRLKVDILFASNATTAPSGQEIERDYSHRRGERR